MLPTMATSHAHLTIALVVAIVIAFVVILAACWQRSRERAGLPVWCYAAIILIAVLLYYRLPEVYSHITTAQHMLTGK